MRGKYLALSAACVLDHVSAAIWRCVCHVMCVCCGCGLVHSPAASERGPPVPLLTTARGRRIRQPA